MKPFMNLSLNQSVIFQDVHKMPLKDYYNKHKPKMPKLSKGATNKASKETDDAEENPKKAVETGED